jgi:nicotinamide riboside transporter PnuC
MDVLTTLGRTMGFSFAAGINLYATVAILGLASRFDWVSLPPQFKVFDNDIVIGAAIVMYLIEFVADKVPWLDSIWDAIHTVIRPVGGALIAVATLGQASPTVEGLAALFGGTLAASTHFTKAGTRAIANASPEPFSNWILSITEDVFVVGLGMLALKHPVLALAVVALCLILMLTFATWIYRAVRRRFVRAPAAAGA